MPRDRSSPRRRAAPSTTHAPSLAANGGRYQPLGPPEVARIAQAVFDILARIGLSDAPPEMAASIIAAGGALSPTDRLLFPEALVKRALAGLPSSVTLCGQNTAHDLQLNGQNSYVGTGGAAPMIVDLDTAQYRPSMLADLYDAARLCDALANVQFFSRSLVARDMADDCALDVNTAFACLAGTTKHVMVSASHPDHVPQIAALCYAIAGSEAAFRARPFLSLNINHVVPPLRFHAESCAVLAAAVRAGIPVHCNIFGQLGASSPVTLAGSVAQTMAEAIAGMVYAWVIDPAAMALCGPRPMITDLRTGGMSGGSGEQAFATAMAMQMCHHFGLPSTCIAGATDAKLPDAQAGYEKALSVTTALHAGAGLVTQACGMQAGLMGVSFEAYVIDNDMLGAILRSAVPAQVCEATLALETIAEVVAGEGHFLGQAETYARMKSDFLYPDIADRRSVDDWQTAGAPEIRATANARVREILAQHFPAHLSADLRDQLRAAYDLHLPESCMRPQ